MKLGDALVAKKDLVKKIAELTALATTNIVVEQGVDIEVNVRDTLDHIIACEVELFNLKGKIAKTNEASGAADIIREREYLLRSSTVNKTLASRAVSRRDRTYGESEVVVYSPQITRADLEEAADAFAKRYRELDAKLQELNWTTDKTISDSMMDNLPQTASVMESGSAETSLPCLYIM